MQYLRPCRSRSIWYLYYVFHVYPLKKIVLVIFGIYLPRRLRIFGDPPHSMSAEKARTKIIFCESPGKSPTPAPPNKSQNQRPTKNKNVVGLPHEPRRNGRNICQANACRQHHQPGRRHLEPPANQQQQDNILRPIIRIMLKALSMFVFL